MQARGYVPKTTSFAGHSLGEYAALTSVTQVMQIEALVEIVFLRGMVMQVTRDTTALPQGVPLGVPFVIALGSLCHSPGRTSALPLHSHTRCSTRHGMVMQRSVPRQLPQADNPVCPEPQTKTLS